MEELNYVSVERKVFSTGVGNELDLPLRINMEKGLDHFSLPYERYYGEVKAEANYNFNKSDKGNYFFNSMDVTIDKAGEVISQRFNIDNTFEPDLKKLYPDLNINFTLKEAVNYLLEQSLHKLHVSRVLKDPSLPFSMENSIRVVKPEWIMANLTDKDKYGNFKTHVFKGVNDVFEQKLKEMPLKMVTDQIRKALRRGDPKVPVIFVIEGKEYKRSIEFNARYRNFKIHDDQLAVDVKKAKDLSTQQTNGVKLKGTDTTAVSEPAKQRRSQATSKAVGAKTGMANKAAKANSNGKAKKGKATKVGG